MLAIGRTRLAPGSWLCAADMTTLPLQDRSVDAALCYGALHHVPEWPNVLAEVHRVLKNGGVLVLQEPGRGHSQQAHERLLNLVTSLHVVVAAKGAPWVDSRRPETLARYRRVECPATLRAGAPTAFRMRVQNTGQTRWLARPDTSGAGQVRLGLSLLDAEGHLRELDFGRCSLPGDVAPGEEVVIDGQVSPVTAPGRYVLRLDLVAEGVSWFADRRTIPWTLPIEVTRAEGGLPAESPA